MSVTWMIGEMLLQLVVIVGAASAIYFWFAVLMGAL
jgi:hypothetical protein